VCEDGTCIFMLISSYFISLVPKISARNRNCSVFLWPSYSKLLGVVYTGNLIVLYYEYVDLILWPVKVEWKRNSGPSKHYQTNRHFPALCSLNVGKTKTVGISRQPSPIQIMINWKQLGNVEIFQRFWYHDNK
jgi:hypothetical protein